MRFLPILLISLALLPLSTALWCHSEKIGKGKVTMRRHDEDCDKEIDFCFTSEYIGGPEKNRGCSEAGKCTSDGCTTEELEDGREKRRCCCKGNCCNGLEKRYWCPKEFSKDGYSLPKKMVPCDEFCATEEYLSAFFGRFKVDRSENFDEFLSAKGVGFLTRQIIKFASVTKVFTKGPSDGSYTFENLSSKKNVKYDFKLGESFTGEGLDGTQHEVTFNYNEGEVAEHHKRLDNPEFTPETYHYTMSDDNKELIMRMTNNGITCKRFFKRQDA